MNIRTANKDDVPQIVSLVHSLAHFYQDDTRCKLPSWFAETMTLTDVEERVASSDCLNLVCELDGAIVGYIALKGGSHLYHLFVAESQQGRGVARRLWEAVIEGSQVQCFTLRSSLYAVPVYRRFGFIEKGPVGSKDGISFQPMELNRTV